MNKSLKQKHSFINLVKFSFIFVLFFVLSYFISNQPIFICKPALTNIIEKGINTTKPQINIFYHNTKLMYPSYSNFVLIIKQCYESKDRAKTTSLMSSVFKYERMGVVNIVLKASKCNRHKLIHNLWIMNVICYSK